MKNGLSEINRRVIASHETQPQPDKATCPDGGFHEDSSCTFCDAQEEADKATTRPWLVSMAMTRQGGYPTAARAWINRARRDDEKPEHAIAAVISTPETAEANAVLIVRAVNEHAALCAVEVAGHFCRQALNALGGFTADEKRQATEQMDKAEAQLALVRQ